MGQFFICKLKWYLFRTCLTACTQLIEIHFCPIWNLLCENKFEKNFFKNFLYNPLMGCSLFSNYHFQMGVTVMRFAEGTKRALLLRLCVPPLFALPSDVQGSSKIFEQIVPRILCKGDEVCPI